MGNLFRKWWLTVWLFTLVFIYPIPHTIALRNLFLITGLASCLWIGYRDKALLGTWLKLRQFRVCGWLLALLTSWLLFQSALISPYPGIALDHLRGDWLNELLVSMTGGCAILLSRHKGIKHPLTAIVLALFAHIVLLLGYQVWQWMQTEIYPLGQTPFAQKDYHSMIVTTLIALLLAELVTHTITSEKKSSENALLPTASILSMLTFSLIATITLLARNAVIITFFMLILSVGVFLFTRTNYLSRKTLAVFIALIAISTVTGWAGLRSDSRWRGFSEAASVAFDTKNNLAWLDSVKYPRPLMSNGEPVEESAYSRLAWAKVAFEQIQVYPLGLGYGHQAFGWAVNRSYNVQTTHESSHSGLLDFTLANGIPGLLLWVALSGALITAGWRAFRNEGSATGLMLSFTVIAYLLRCLLDGHLSGFRLEMYALLIGALIVAQASEKQRCN
ncbi:MAG: O-antigen ligase family protein [Betaproteobacteria bacterium]